MIVKLARSRAWQAAAEEGVLEKHFTDRKLGELYDRAQQHSRRYGSPPSFDVVCGWDDSFRHADDVVDSLDWTIAQFKRDAKRRYGIEVVRRFAKKIDDADPNELDVLDEILLDEARQLSQLVPSQRVRRFSEMGDRIEEWKRRKAVGKLPGMAMGIPSFDKHTLGIQKHEYVSIVGWQGTGKSTLLQLTEFNQYLDGATPMLISLEMDAETINRRFDIMATHVQHRAMKALELDDPSVAVWEQAAERAAQAKNDIIVIDDVGRCTVDRIYAEAVRWKPDIVGVDYVSLLDAPRSAGNALWERVTYLTRELKTIARSLQIPVIGVAQTNIGSATEGARLDNIAYSRSIGQDSDLVFGLHSDDEMREQKKMEVRMLKNRDGTVCETAMLWDLDTMQFREWRESDLFQRKHTTEEKTTA